MSKSLHRDLEAKLAALDGPEWDSSDEEIAEPKAMKKIVKKKDVKEKDKIKKQPRDPQLSRVIYLGHLPPAFEEPQILAFLSQFGKITNIKLSRSKKTGNPRGYAFVEFSDEEVAVIVANTMNGYFLKGERRLVCHILPKDKIHSNLFSGSKENLAKCQAGLTASDYLTKMHGKVKMQVNQNRSVEALNKITKRLLSREKKKREQLKNLGIDYEFPGYASSVKQTEGDPEISERKRRVSIDSDHDDGKESSQKRKVSIDSDHENESSEKDRTTPTKNSLQSKKKAKKKKKRSASKAPERNQAR